MMINLSDPTVTLYHEGDSDSETIALSSDDENDGDVENEKF